MVPEMRRQMRMRMLLVVAALAVGGAVWLGAQIQRDSATIATERLRAAAALRAAVVDEVTALQGLETDRDAVAAIRSEGHREFQRAVALLEDAAEEDARVDRALDAVKAAEARWRDRADALSAAADERSARRTKATQTLLERFDTAVDGLDAELERLRVDDQAVSMLATIILALLAVLVVVGGGMYVLHRRLRAEAAVAEAERRHRQRQDELGRALLSAASEDEVHELLERHLGHGRDGRTVAVLESDPDRDRLVTRTALDPAGPLSTALADAAPRDCAAVRLGAPHAEGAGEEPPLVRCEVCAGAGRDRLCAPLVASGEVIGSVLAAQDAPLDEDTRRQVAESVTIAAPVLANLRTIALAETRAATDPLTGLPNRRALDDMLKRMVAQSLRRESPLASSRSTSTTSRTSTTASATTRATRSSPRSARR